MAIDLTAGDLRKVADLLDLLTEAGNKHDVMFQGHSGVQIDIPAVGSVRIEWRDHGDGAHYVAVVGEE